MTMFERPLRTLDEINGTPPDSPQEAFDRVVDYFFGHRKPQAILRFEDGVEQGCVYSQNGLKCAIGCMIPPWALPVPEGDLIDLFANFPKIADWFSLADEPDFLDNLQRAHDRANTCIGFRVHLEGVAGFHSLNASRLDLYPDYAEFTPQP